MCGIYQNPYEIARSLTVAATDHVVVNTAGKSVEQSNAELGRQVALIYRTILHELLHDDLMQEGAEGNFENHVHSHAHEHDSDHIHDHEHTHSHLHDHEHSLLG